MSIGGWKLRTTSSFSNTTSNTTSNISSNRTSSTVATCQIAAVKSSWRANLLQCTLSEWQCWYCWWDVCVRLTQSRSNGERLGDQTWDAREHSILRTPAVKTGSRACVAVCQTFMLHIKCIIHNCFPGLLGQSKFKLDSAAIQLCMCAHAPLLLAICICKQCTAVYTHQIIIFGEALNQLAPCMVHILEATTGQIAKNPFKPCSSNVSSNNIRLPGEIDGCMQCCAALL